jgi:hypothetical protein
MRFRSIDRRLQTSFYRLGQIPDVVNLIIGGFSATVPCIPMLQITQDPDTLGIKHDEIFPIG